MINKISKVFKIRTRSANISQLNKIWVFGGFL